MLGDFEECLPVVILVGIVTLFVLLIVATVNEGREWEKFKVDHSCKVVAHIKGELFNTVDSRGNVGIGGTSDKTGWLCDDGQTYFR
jgi:hypothetical protein